MATIACQFIGEEDGRAIYQWGPMAAGDTCLLLDRKGDSSLAGSVQFGGSGGTVTLQGSNDGVTWFDLLDVTGSIMSATGGALFEFSSSVAYLRASPGVGLSGGTALLCFRG